MTETISRPYFTRLLGRFDSACVRLLLAVLLASQTGSVLANIIPPSRVISWDPGVRGGITNRTTIYTTLPAGSTAAQINAAINACPSGQVVKLAAGTFPLGTAEVRIKGGITLRGAGMGQTILTGGGNVNMLTFVSSGADTSWTNGTARDLTSSGLTKGSNTIHTSTAHGWSVGDYIMIDQLSDPSGDPPRTASGTGTCTWCGRANGARPINQWVQITGIANSTTATINPPLYMTYNTAKSPQGYKVLGATTNAGLEDITLDNSINQKRDTMEMDFPINCWLLRVELKGSYRRNLWMYGGLWNTIKQCKIHDGTPANPQPGPSYDTNRAYGIFLGPGPTACLVEDNIFYALTVAVAFEGGVSGNVFSYNYVTNILWKDTPATVAHMTVLGHGGHSEQNLVEGNWLGGRFGVDNYWGTGAYFTVFRNRIQQQAPRSEQTWTVDIDRNNWYQNIIGNVLGTDGVENRYQLTGEHSDYGNGHKAIYRLGYDTIATDGADPQVLATIYRHGNWDYFNHAQLWESSNSDHTIPNSFYLSSKPSWFGNLTWPPYNPASPGSAAVTNIPAGYRYVNGVSPPTGTPTPSPTPVSLVNISSRALVQTDDNVLIGGFIITGTQNKRVLLRAIGPSLPLSGKLTDPVLELHDNRGALIASNDNWVDASNRQDIANTGASPTDARESAILRSFAPGLYTAIVRGVGNTTGIALVEAYDLDRTTASKFANISTRGLVQTGNNVLIGGFVLLGAGSQNVIVRAMGPSLPLADKLTDPTLDLHDAQGAKIASNDNWRTTQEAEITAAGFQPPNNFESVVARRLTPGPYTAIVRGVNGTTGLALVEINALN